MHIPVTGNGDVHSMAEARRMVAETGCGSVMIGRGALGSPWVFDEAFDALSPAGSATYKARVIARHCELIRQHFREKYALIQMKKHLAWYTEGLGHATRCRAEIFQTRRPTRSGACSSATGTRPPPSSTSDHGPTPPGSCRAGRIEPAAPRELSRSCPV